MYNLRSELYPVLIKNWQLGDLFLDKTINNNQEARVKIYSSLRLKMVHTLNQHRRDILPLEFRQQLSIEDQQMIVGIALGQRTPRRHHPIQAREQPAAKRQPARPGLFTQALEQAHDEKDLIPNELICPITGEIFRDPVKLVQNVGDKQHAYYFERNAIEKWLEEKPTNPINRQPARISDIQDAPEKKAEVDRFKEEVRAQHAETIGRHQMPRPRGSD